MNRIFKRKLVFVKVCSPFSFIRFTNAEKIPPKKRRRPQEPILSPRFTSPRLTSPRFTSPVESSPRNTGALLSGRFELLIISESKIDATLPNSMFHCSLSDSFRLCRDSKAGDSGLLIYGSFHICFIRAKELKGLPSALFKKKKLSLTEDLSVPNLFGKFVKHCAHAG